MSKILVLITTDHEDHDEAIKSVSGAMKRAGYNFRDYETGSFQVEGWYGLLVRDANGFVQVVEPEVDDRG